MKHLLYKLNNNVPLLIIPDVTSHMDGHPVLSYTYDLFLSKAKDDAASDILTIPVKHDNPDYYGHIIFERPGQLFNYHHGQCSLTRSQVEEVIEYISYVRDNPDLWKV